MIVKLKYQDGVTVEKLIPKRYEKGSNQMRLSYIDEPKKKRLSPMERFIMAELTWRADRSFLMRDYLIGAKPGQIVVQTNRDGERRYVVRYGTEKAGNYPVRQAIVPHWVFKACPKDKISQEKLYW